MVLTEPSAGPEQQLQSRETSDILWGIVARLKKRQREVLTAVYRQDEPVSDIAVRLGLSRSMIYSHHERGIAALRSELKKRGLNLASLACNN